MLARILAVRKVRFGMVGGGEGAFIGAVHRAAAALDQALTLVCGAFASDPDRSRRSGASFGLPPERCYPDFGSMFAAEAKLPAEQRMELVTIVTPNNLHLPVATAAFRHGFHVLSDKPATTSLAECLELRDALRASDCLYGLTHPYAFYPLVIEAAERVRAGALGTVRKVLVEYTQGWLAEPIERRGQKQAIWRLDPERAGSSCCMGDIGVHAFNLAELVTGLRTTELCADLSSVVSGRVLDDDGAAFLRFDNGARGVLVASQICTGDENDLRLRVYGDAGSLEWRQQEPNTLVLKHAHKPAELLRSGGPGLGAAARAHSRLPSGHPEGYLEAFANVYRSFAAQVRARSDGNHGAPPSPAVPGIGAALRGMAFIETVVAASKSAQKWHALPRLSD
jgi:predicted dehydrogenase